jgi:ankyrin repeat protein
MKKLVLKKVMLSLAMMSVMCVMLPDSLYGQKVAPRKLIAAAKKGNVEEVKALLEQGADVNATNMAGETPLIWASLKGHTETVKVLVEKGADVNIVSKNGNTALTLAAGWGRAEAVKILLEHGADMSIIANNYQIKQNPPKFNNSNTPFSTAKISYNALGIAIQGNHVETIIALLEHIDVNAADHNGRTALMYASVSGFTETAKDLLEKGADMNIVDGNGHTALMHASANGHIETATVLLEKGADVNATDKYGFTALMLASTTQGIQVQMSGIPIPTPAKAGHIEMVKVLLEKGAEVNVADKNGRTALMHASAARSNTETVKALLEKGADVNVADKKGKTALSLTKDESTKELLKAHGAK